MEVDPPAPEHFGQRSDSEKISKMSEDLPNNQAKGKMSSTINRQTTFFPVKTGHYLVGNEGIYKVGEFLGEEGFGQVAKCTKMGCQEFFAIKIIDDVESGKKEFENNLVKLYECFLFENVICLVYEILGESLLDRMRRQDFVPTHLCKLRPVAQQMFQALSALKSISVAHMDIKVDNIMYVDEESSKIKLIDFGLAIKTKEMLTGSNIQVIPFRAPEVILGLPMDESVDMWALGIVFATMCRGDFPFPCGTEYETIRGEHVGNVDHVANFDEMTEIHREQFELFDDDDHRAFNDLLKRMLEVDPINRITPSQALEHDFITMRHLSGESQASYAATAKNEMCTGFHWELQILQLVKIGIIGKFRKIRKLINDHLKTF
uniref:Protein kinase domain-containing protein n=1 Tax=Oryzias latipes TaxID=8090 RepID=A0A3B3HHE9_ORYLA